ncbi:MAG: PepSY domain-containing protein [Gammaproteobacteria bacterium]|nr:PepSY domain-containing protein [Gammaproteobacteria bacterium]
MSRRKKPFAFFLWHRRIGLAALLLIFILSITGIMLNHTEYLKLDETIVESDLILNWYNINPQGVPVNYKAGDSWVSQWNQQLFFNGLNFSSHKEKLQGLVKIDDIIAIALEKFVLLIDNEGEIIELMPVTFSLPIKKIGITDNKIALLDTANNFYISNSDFTNWQTDELATTNWAIPFALSETQISTLKKSYRGQGLNLERVILDLHSGRLFNDKWGIYIMDISALLMMLLGISGFWVWWSRKLKISRKKHYKKHH